MVRTAPHAAVPKPNKDSAGVAVCRKKCDSPLRKLHRYRRHPLRQHQLYAALELILREGSIRKAAEYLTISPSALNRQVQALEADLGVPLFERSARGVRLSSAGEIYYRHFSEQLAAFERARETVAALQGLRIGHVRVAVSPDLAAHCLPSALAAFRVVHPRLRLAVQRAAERPAEALEAASSDLALVLAATPPDGTEVLATAEIEAVAIVPAASGAEPLRPGDLLDHDLILPPETSPLRRAIDRYGRRRRLSLRPAVVTEDPVAPVVIAGRPTLQIRLAPDIAPGWLAASAARVRPLPSLPPLRAMVLQAEGRVLPVAAARFAEVLAACLGQVEAGRGTGGTGRGGE